LIGDTWAEAVAVSCIDNSKDRATNKLGFISLLILSLP
jgi:hypothetical protein